MRPNNLGGYDRLTLRQLLNGQGDIIEKVFAGMGQNMAFYFRLALTEKLGMNLRNDFVLKRAVLSICSKFVGQMVFLVLVVDITKHG